MSANGRSASGPRHAQLERRASLTADELLRGYIATSTPVILAGRAAHWPALKRWSLEHLRATHPDVMVPALVDLPVGSVPYAAYMQDHTRTMSLAEFVDWMTSARRELPCYLSQASFDAFPLLREDFDFEGIAPAMPGRLVTNLWLGSAGTRSGLHFDSRDNLLAQVVGTKRLSLVPAQQFREVYAFPWNVMKSQVDTDTPDLARYPKFAEVTIWEGQIEPGDVLFLPAGWWHNVVSLDHAISINRWFGAQKHDQWALYRRIAASGPTYWVEFLRQFAVNGVLGVPYERHLFSGHPHGVKQYHDLAARFKAALRRLRSSPRTK
jgi:lysine-specific demethylase 8